MTRSDGICLPGDGRAHQPTGTAGRARRFGSVGFRVTLAFVLGTALGVVIERYFIRPGLAVVDRQRINLIVAEQELPKVKALLRNDERFADVRAGAYTARYGSVGLFGRVRTEDDLFRLMREVAELKLTAPVSWQVKVGDPE
jgi:hypothetical protein